MHEWIIPLNAIDSCLTYIIKQYPAILLIEPVKRSRGRGANGVLDNNNTAGVRVAESLQDVANVPTSVIEQLTILLRFLSGLLRNSSSKSVFNSVEELVDLLAAADDNIASIALETLCNLAVPPSLHKQQSPEVMQHSTGLHNSKSSSHRRLIALARGWGTRGSGLGLYTCVTADDSEFGQGSLPQQAGDLDFAFSASPAVSEDESDNNDFQLITIHLSPSEIIEEDAMQTECQISSGSGSEDVDMTKMDTSEASKKRRRVGPVDSTTAAKETKSAAALFFLCLEKAGGRKKVPEDRLFSLLADIRLARAFYSHNTRVKAVDRRLKALITILYSHPSQEIMSGYFQAQPELCVELIDLLRPTVSSTNVSATSGSSIQPTTSPLSQDALGALAASPIVPYGTRMLAVEALTALVGRRDGSNGALTGTARHSSVLTELGIGKGQYLGLVPTLLRYSLASLGSSFSETTNANQSTSSDNDNPTFDIGLAFVEATSSPPAPRIVQLERALEFIDSVLTLTSAIVSTPTGTSALTDCGLIPALLATAAMDSRSFVKNTLPDSSSYPRDEIIRVESLLRFVTAQAIQILEGAIVTHNNALSAFHDLQGIEVLTRRLHEEISNSQRLSSSVACDNNVGEKEDVIPMDCEDGDNSTQLRMVSSQRVLVFSILTALTVVVHAESASSSTSPPSGGLLRNQTFMQSLMAIFNNIHSFGGHLGSLASSLISDILNNDPTSCHPVHQSGLARVFLDFVKNSVVPVPELVLALPNVISALALTEEGAKNVKEANPFPSLLSLFHSPDFAMPKSRCLLNELTAIVGTGLDEIMRHVQILKPLVLSAITKSLNHIVSLAEDLSKREDDAFDMSAVAGNEPTSLENERTCLMQYVLNFGQLLEQILHNEDHCDPFVEAGGLDALLRLFPSVMTTGFQFLSHLSSLSCPSVSTLQHSTIEESLCLAFKCIAVRYDPLKLIQETVTAVNLHLEDLQQSQASLQLLLNDASTEQTPSVDASFALEGLPPTQLHGFSRSNTDDESMLKALSKYLSAVSSVQWITGLLGVAIKAACQRNQESSGSRDWKKELSSKDFESLVEKLSTFHQSSIFECSRIRSSEGFEKRERDRQVNVEKMRYRLRIVCPEGAVVRDGIEIDSCASVGNMEMGEIAEAFDRCVNSSGIVRYRTQRGWVSEMTRGHGREPISEVISFWPDSTTDTPPKSRDGDSKDKKGKRRAEAPIPDLLTVAASVLARGQTSYSELFCALSRSVIQGVRSLPSSSLSFPVGSHLATSVKILSSNIQRGFNRSDVIAVVGALDGEPIKGSSDQSNKITPQGVSMYLGCLLNHLQAFLFEEKRERKQANVVLLLSLLETTTSYEGGEPSLAFLDAAKFTLLQSLRDFESRSDCMRKQDDEVVEISKGRAIQHFDRTIAASLPPTISLLQKLMAGSLITSSPVSAILSRFKRSDICSLLGHPVNASGFNKEDDDETLFSPESFVMRLHFSVSEVAREAWIDPKFICCPPHIVHPFATLIREVISGLEEAPKKKAKSRSSRTEGSNPFDIFSQVRRRGNDNSSNEEFEPNDAAVARLTDMGFSRDHALDAFENTRTNNVQIAMEYALSHPPPSPSTVERRRAQREERQRQREERQSQAAGAAGTSTTAGGNEGEDGVEGETSSAAMDVDSPQGEAANQGESTSGGKSQDSDKTEIEKDNDEERAKSMVETWIKEVPRVSFQILSGLSSEQQVDVPAACADEGKRQEDAQSEALTVVLCAFLLDICERYPSESTNIAKEALSQLKGQISQSQEGDTTIYSVHPGKEKSFAALCHSAVLFSRALPETRSLVLKENLVQRLSSCIKSLLKCQSEALSSDSTAGKSQTRVWPMWLASAVLVLEVMAQPVVAFSKADSNQDDRLEQTAKNEYDQVKDEHQKQSSELAATAAKIFSALSSGGRSSSRPVNDDSKGTEDGHNDDEMVEDTQEKKESTTSTEKNEPTSEKKTTEQGFFSSVPAYFPLLPLDSVDSCVEICHNLLKTGKGTAPPPPPGVVHAILLLLLRLLRTHKMSSHCLQIGMDDAILSLPKECRFTGNSGLVTLILRRLLEDESTLQAMMETEIRSTGTTRRY